MERTSSEIDNDITCGKNNLICHWCFVDLKKYIAWIKIRLTYIFKLPLI